VTSVSFDVPINNDSVLEANETFHLSVIPSSLPGRISQSDPNETDISITDDESKCCVFINICRKKGIYYLNDYVIICRLIIL